jgi:hypothetical protein
VFLELYLLIVPLEQRHPPFVNLFVRMRKVEDTSVRHLVIGDYVFSVATASAEAALAAFLPIGVPCQCCEQRI